MNCIGQCGSGVAVYLVLWMEASPNLSHQAVRPSGNNLGLTKLPSLFDRWKQEQSLQSSSIPASAKIDRRLFRIYCWSQHGSSIVVPASGGFDRKDGVCPKIKAWTDIINTILFEDVRIVYTQQCKKRWSNVCHRSPTDPVRKPSLNPEPVFQLQYH